jgi:cyclic pyranopterin phosphate synthase
MQESVTARPALVDGFGRVATDLRISITDRCNFRCSYCMPPEGLDWMAQDKLLTYDEITRIAGVLVASGVRSVKITGGEPLVRRDVGSLVAKLKALDKSLDISLTTNGYLLAEAAAGLSAAGLDRVTVSCDSLQRHRFETITRRDALDTVLGALVTASRAGLTPVKVNTVMMRSVNDDEELSFAELARDTGYEVRFIEYMPLDAQGDWSAAGVVPASETLARINDRYPLVLEDSGGPAPATSYRFADGAPGRIAAIPSVTEPFCASCDRLRLTADGQLRACLFSLEETDLRTPLRSGANDDDIAALARSCVAGKWAGHRIGKADFVKPARSMSQIGG